MIFIHNGERKITHHDRWPSHLSMEITWFIPRGIIYQIDFKTSVNRLVVEIFCKRIYTPKRYKMNRVNI
jgi:hypothetical protein